MNAKKTVKSNAMKVMAALCAKSSEHNANSACMLLIGQPKQPKAVKKLRKF
ncbi:MAG: cyclic lactone autoinducer peptide [Oscillospiraceae bacterium]|nr:cyclic lactone autoinducer peptide [Oscillospiraceae bacterium]